MGDRANGISAPATISRPIPAGRIAARPHRRTSPMTLSPSLEQRLARLEAESAIHRLIADLGHAFDSGPSAAALRDLFTPDAQFTVDGYGVLTGADGIADGVAGNAATGFRWTLHFLVSPRIDLAADACSAALSFMLWETATAASGRAYWIGGSYHAQAVATPERWRFARLALRADLISHYPEGWHAKPAALDHA